VFLLMAMQLLDDVLLFAHVLAALMSLVIATVTIDLM
jgi:hypothetical protein